MQSSERIHRLTSLGWSILLSLEDPFHENIALMLSMVKNTLNRVKKTLSCFDMIRPGDKLVVAVSGGPDSVCLLDILLSLRDEFSITLVVAHFEHGLRPTEDPSETEFVHRLAGSLNLPFEIEKASRFSDRWIRSVEEAARNARYEFLERVRIQYGAQKIALGHTLNDQAETILMRLLRGSGSGGLASIPPVRDKTIIRPLIEVERREIEVYLASRNLPYIIDNSNLQTTYLRNKIRLELMPFLHKVQPQIIKLLGQTATILRREEEYLEQIAQEWVIQEAQSQPDGSLLVSIPAFLSAPTALRNRVTRILIKRIKTSLRRITLKHIESVFHLARSERPQAALNFPQGLCVKRIYDRLYFTTAEKENRNGFSYEIPGPGVFYLGQIDSRIILEEIARCEDLRKASSPWTVHLDADKIHYPIVIRNAKPGDRFIPLGMKGHKKIKDFFVDLKVPMEVRHKTPILTSKELLLWVAGFRLDDRFKITDDTKKILRVTLSPLAKRGLQPT